jgi:hypothetical protein|tara:strand:- start:33 stop:398 length:366 start_codon:yes stop_codon:yes gene_type:complete
MKQILLILAAVTLVGCATTPTIRSVAGEYEIKDDRFTTVLIYSPVFLENGVYQDFVNGKKTGKEYKWTISKEGEIHIEWGDGGIGVYRVNRDGSITWIAEIDREGRKDLSKIHQKTWGKIK